MCGVVAITTKYPNNWDISQPLQSIRHRGEDDQGIYVSTNRDCYLGHVRLSILDLSKSGHQPMSDATGRFIISYNGEVYNYHDLKVDLENKYGTINWNSNTDTEVIIEGFARENVSFLDKLNGIFSLVIYDVQERLSYVLRDPLGIKPMFFTEQFGAVFFCSELKGLLAISELKLTLRHDSLAAQLAFMYVPEPHTLYCEVEKTQPGVCFVYKYGCLVSSIPLFSHLVSGSFFSTEDEAISELQQTFSTAVRRQLVSDVPVSLFLSGGLDSSAVAREAVYSGAKVKDAYTIAFSADDRKFDAQSDDLHYAHLMANRLGINLEVITAKQDMLSILPEVIQFMDDGFTDPAAINTYIMCDAARKNGIKVILSGQGADEHLGGYRRYLAEKILNNIPAPLRSVLSLFAKILPEQISGRFNAINRRIKRIGALSGKSIHNRIFSMYSWAEPREINNLFVGQIGSSYKFELLKLYDLYSDNDIVDAMMYIDHQYDLMSLNLCYTDRMSMANGVEARVPFLDFDLIRVMNSIPAKLKVKGQHGKYVFKKAMEAYLPHEIIYREKAGFGLPIRAWMSNSKDLLSHYLDKTKIEQQGIFNSSVIDQLLQEQYQGKKDNSYLLLTLLTQQIWLDNRGIY